MVTLESDLRESDRRGKHGFEAFLAIVAALAVVFAVCTVGHRGCGRQ